MMDNKNIPDADQSWTAAEKMLDRHFRKRRLLIWFLSFIIPAMIVGFFVVKNQVNSTSENNIGSSENEFTSVSPTIKESEVNNKNQISENDKLNVKKVNAEIKSY